MSCVRCNNVAEDLTDKLCKTCHEEHVTFINKFDADMPFQDQLPLLSKILKKKKMKRCRRCNDTFSKLKSKLCTECFDEHSAWISKFDSEKPLAEQLIGLLLQEKQLAIEKEMAKREAEMLIQKQQGKKVKRDFLSFFGL
jgi:protein-arginine kinase activator protein McsA